MTATEYLSTLSSIAFALVATAVVVGLVVISLVYVWKVSRNIIVGYKRYSTKIKFYKQFKHSPLKVVEKKAKVVK